MSGLIKSTKSESQIAAKSARTNAKKNLKTEQVKFDGEPAHAKTNLEDVAIAIADASTAKAIQTFNARTAENLGKFAAHVQATQEQTSEQMIDQIYGYFGITAEELYDDNQASAIQE